jgi:hypothetical protein
MVVWFIGQYLKKILSKYLKIQNICIFIPEHIYMITKQQTMNYRHKIPQEVQTFY